jgi:hypothetical protein
MPFEVFEENCRALVQLKILDVRKCKRSQNLEII